MALTELEIKNAKSTGKDSKLWDGNGLYLLLTTAGGKIWRAKYRFAGKEKIYVYGKYPGLKLKEAREAHANMRKLLDAGIDPANEKKANRSLTTVSTESVPGTVEEVVRLWHKKKTEEWSQHHSEEVISLFEQHVFPSLGSRSVLTVTRKEIYEMISRIAEKKGKDMARRILFRLGAAFRHGMILNEKLTNDPTYKLSEELGKRPKTRNHPAATEPATLREVLRKMRGNYTATFGARCAVNLIALLFVRSGEMREARWEDIDFENKIWRYTIGKTDIGEHIVPLPDQAIYIFSEMLKYKKSEFVFPPVGIKGSTNKVLAAGTLSGALRLAGITKEESSVHGFRASAHTLLQEEFEYNWHVLERQLAHAVQDDNGTAYNRARFINVRRKMLIEWANYLDTLSGMPITECPAIKYNLD